MKKNQIEKKLKLIPQRSNSTGNLLAKRLYRNNSLTKLTPLNASVSLLGSLNTSLIPSVSLRRLAKLDHSPPSIEISQGKIHLRKGEDLPYLSQTGSLLKKKAARKFQKIDSITQKSILPQDLKADISSYQVKQQIKKFKPSRKWLTKLKQGRQTLQEKLTPQDFIQLIQEEGGLGNQFCYLEKGQHPYDLKIVEFAGVTGDQYITISARGLTYFNWEGSRFVSLQEWRRQAELFNKLMKLEFFGKYKLHKNFSNWKKYSRKIGMKKTTDKLKAQLLVHDRHLRLALLNTRDLCCRMEKQTYCYLDDSAPPLAFSKFKSAQESYLEQQFEKRLNEFQQEIKSGVANSLSISMRDFKQENKISSGKQAKGLPLLIGDQKNLQMPYTKQATLRVQQQKFKRFLKLIELLVVQSKVAMMNESTHATARKLQQQNESYREYLLMRSQKGKDNHFKGKQYIQCHLFVDESEQRAVLKPTRQQLTNFMQDIVNKSIIKLVRNHHRIINDPDINAILYEGSQQQNRQNDVPNTLKLILGAQQKQQQMVNLLTRSISISYNYLQDYVINLTPLIIQYFKNQNQLNKISQLNSSDYYIIRQWIQKWRKQLQDINKLNQQHQSAVFILNFKIVKETAIQCSNMCLSKMKQIVPRILQSTLRRQQYQLKQSMKLMQVIPIGIQIFIKYQQNKINITSKLDQYQETLGQIGQLIEILKQLGSSSQTAVLRGSKDRKQLAETLKNLRAKIQQAQMHSKIHQNYAQQQVRKLVPKVFQQLNILYGKTMQPRLEAREMCRLISGWQEEYLQIERQLQKLMRYHKFLGMEEICDDSIVKYRSYFKVYESIWRYRLKIEQYYENILNTEWKYIEIQNIKKQLQIYLEQCEMIKKSILRVNRQQSYKIEYIDENIINNTIGDIKKKIRPLIQSIECIKDGSIQQREQRFIKGELQKRDKYDLAQIFMDKQGRISDLIKYGIIQQLDFLKKIVFKSKKQLQLNSKMSSVNKFWGESVNHSSKNLIDNFSQYYWSIVQQIDEKITVINCVRQDPEIQQGEFKNRVQNEKNMFDSLRLLLNEWQKHHNFLIYFEPIFSNLYWKGTSQFKLYTYAQSNWKKLTKQISKDFSLRKLVTQQKKHLSILKQNNNIFQDLKYSVQIFLNSKRQSFNKLYFLSNQELLHLLLQDKDYGSIDKHLSRIFPNLKSLELNQERNSPIAVHNMINQTLTLRPYLAKQVLEFDQGLRVIQDRMKEAIKSGLAKCSAYYMQDDFIRSQWIKQNILQILLFIGNAQFTKLLQYDYLQPEGQDPSQLLTYQLSQIKQLHSMIKDEMHNHNQVGTSYKLSILILQAGHFRDIILRILQQNVTDENSFEWQREVRSYYNANDTAITKYFTRSVQYGYEFVCSNSSFIIGMLSQRQIIEVINTAAFGYIPVLSGHNQIVQALCNSNAKSYFSLNLKPQLSTSFIQNVCQGAFSSSTFLQLEGLEYFSAFAASTISNFIFQTKSMLQRREAFHQSFLNKNGFGSPSFNICFRINNKNDLKPIQQFLKISYRVIKVVQIAISTYLHCVTQLAFFSADRQLAMRIQKCCQIINTCCGYRIIGLQQIRMLVLSSISMNSQQFKLAITKNLIKEINNKISQSQDIKFFQAIVSSVILGKKVEEGSKNKVKLQWDSKLLVNHIGEAMKKKQACLLVGPQSGKTHLILQTYKASGLDPAFFYTDLVTQEQFLGTFQNGLWKQGILSRHLKKLSFSQEQWLIFEGNFSKMLEEIIKSAVDGYLLQLNGQKLYFSPNWKFLVLSQILKDDYKVPVGCEMITSERFSQFDEQLQHQLQIKIMKYFKSNIEGYGVLKNLCINNFEKILKFRLKSRFLRPEQILNGFISVLQSILARSPEKQIQQKQNTIAIQKLFIWSIFWTINTSLNIDQSKKFQIQFFQQIKIDFDRSQPLNICKFDFDSPQGSLRRIQQPIVHMNDTPYFVSQGMEAIAKFTELLLSQNKHVLLFGDESSGKSEFLGYIRQVLGTQNYSFLKIRFSKGMTFDKLQQLLHRKAKIIVNSLREKRLSAINGKKLIIILDDINLVEEQSKIGRFLKSILTLGYFYDNLSLEKIYLGNVSILAAENSSHQFRLTYQFIRNFKPVYISPPSVRDIVDLYHHLLVSEHAVQLCHNIASLHQFVLLAQGSSDIYFKRSIEIPCRILKALCGYRGRQNMVKLWQYLSIKLYIQCNKQNQSLGCKIVGQIKNYSNLLLKNNQQQPYPLENGQQLMKDLLRYYPFISIDNRYNDYYIYLTLNLKFQKSFNLFTINQPLSPSQKQEIIYYICVQNQIEYFHPYRGHEILSKQQLQSKVVIYASDSDEYFDEIIDEMLGQSRAPLIYIIDFASEQSWRNTMNKHPSIITFGCRYYKAEIVSCRLNLSEGLLHAFNYWLQIFNRYIQIQLSSQQEVTRIINRNYERLLSKLQALVARREKMCSIFHSIEEKIVDGRKELEVLNGEIEEMGRLEQKKRRELLQLKNNYQGQMGQAQKIQRNQKILGIQNELNVLMNRRRTNQDRLRMVNEQLNKNNKISNIISPIIGKIRQQLGRLAIIKNERDKIICFLSLVEYYYTKGDDRYDAVIEMISKYLPISFEDIMVNLFNCWMRIEQKYGVIWLMNQKSIIIEDNSQQFWKFIEIRYKNIHLIREIKDLEDISQLEDQKAYIFIGEIRSQAMYQNDLLLFASDKERIKKEETKDREERIGRDLKQQRPDYSKNIYFIMKERQKDQKFVKDTSQINSTVSMKSRQLKDQIPIRKIERKATRMNTIRNTLTSINLSNTHKKQQSKFSQKNKNDTCNFLKEEATIKIKYKEAKDEGFSKNDPEFQDYLIVNLQNQVYYKGGKRIVSVHSRFHKNVSNVTFICRKGLSKQSRENIHKYQYKTQQADSLYGEFLEAVDPTQTAIINNLQQELQKIRSKYKIQQKIMLDRLLEANTKSLNEIAKNEDFIQNLRQNVRCMQQKVAQARRVRDETYSAFFKYCLIIKDFKPILQLVAPNLHLSKNRIRQMVLGSIKYNENIERNGEMIEPDYKIDQNESICQFKKSLIRQIIISQNYLGSLNCVCLFGILLETKEEQTDKAYITAFLELISKKSEKCAMERLLNQKQCSKDLCRIFESIVNSSGDYTFNCHQYIQKRLGVNLQKQYEQIKSSWYQFNERLIVISSSNSDPYVELFASRNSFLIKESADYGKCIEIMVERNYRRLVLVNFSKEEGYNRMLSLFEELPKESYSFVLLFTSEYHYQKCSFINKIRQFRVVMLDQIKSPSHQLPYAIEKIQKNTKSDHTKSLKFVIFNEIVAYFRERVKCWNQGFISENACFYNIDFILSILQETQIEDYKKMVYIMTETIYYGKQDTLKDLRRWVKKQDEDNMGKTFHSSDVFSLEENCSEFNHFIQRDLSQIRNQLISVVSCEELARSILSNEDRKLLKIDLFYTLQIPIKLLSSKPICSQSLQQQFNFLQNITFESFKTLQTVSYRRQNDIFKSWLRKINIRQYLLYKWIEHQIKSLKSLNSHVILTKSTQQILLGLISNQICFGLANPIHTYLQQLQANIYYVDDLYTSNTPFKKLNLSYWNKMPHMVNLYLYSISKKNDLLNDIIIAKPIIEKEEKERGWLIGQIELSNCKYDAIRNCLEINDKNDVRKIQKVGLILAQKQVLPLPTFTLPLLFNGEQRFKLEIGSKLKEESTTLKQRIYGVIKTPE